MTQSRRHPRSISILRSEKILRYILFSVELFFFVIVYIKMENSQITADDIFKSSDPIMLKMFQNAVGLFWSDSEVEASKDNLDTVPHDIVDLIKTITTFFSVADVIVMQNTSQFITEIYDKNAQLFYRYQAYNEAIHSIVYSNFFHHFVKEKEQSIYLSKTSDIIREKIEFAKKFTDLSLPLRQRIFGFTIIEHIFFSGSFASIYWIKSQRYVPEFTRANDLISKDEATHVDFGCHFLKKLNAIDSIAMSSLIREAVEIEIRFASKIMPKYPNFSIESMTQYIQYIADYLLASLGLEKVYFSKNPFEFMNSIHLQIKSNFFEREGTAYSATSGINDTFRPIVSKRQRVAIE
jgi:ribonucleotide reductase beta subunit family protein with ferritin-like domain